MSKVKVTILKGGMTAREVGNCVCQHPDASMIECEYPACKRVFTIDVETFQKESIKKLSDGIMKVTRVSPELMKYIYKEGSIHEAEIIDEEKGLIRINQPRR